MIKTDYEILITGILVTLAILLADIPATVNKISEIGESMQTLKNESVFKDIENTKNNEKNIWSQIKGVANQQKPANNTGDIQAPLGIPNQKCNCQNEPQTQPKEVQKSTEKINMPATILLVGDSMMQVGFGPSLETKLLEYKNVTVVRDGRFSTGLNRIDYFDWYQTTTDLVNANKPDVLIVMFGANDGQGIIDDDGKTYQLEDPMWDTAYTKRVDRYLELFADKVKRIYWVGHPIPKDENQTDVTSFYNKFARMNKIYSEEIKKFANVEYVDAWSRFAIDGKYSPILADNNGLSQLVKGSDGVHVTNHGGNILADFMIGNMDEVELEKKEE